MRSDINAAALKMLRPGDGEPLSWRNVMTVDPGLGGTGLAYWSRLARRRKPTIRPDWVDVLHEDDADTDWTTRVVSIASHVPGKLRDDLDVVFIEVPRLWSRSKSSRAAASRGDLTKLSVLAGAIMQALSPPWREAPKIVAAFPADWKGQLTKPAVGRRIKRALGEDARYPDHAADAVGMGLAIQGVL